MDLHRSLRLLPVLLAAIPFAIAFAASAAPAPKAAIPAVRVPQYNRDIRPILVANCFSCHGPDSAARKAGLRLDRFADATAAREGGAAVVPGDPIASAMILRIFRTGDDPMRMPPIEGHAGLSDEDKGLLVRWIASGARYEPHWAYLPPRRSPLPAVRNSAWVRNAIDRFVLARLEASGLQPAPEADRRTLVRRLSLDLTGLPPTPAEVERFVSDRSPNAYEALVDRYLASPRWGEQQARCWLDDARYADTHGIHFDNYREMWSYRDWVIQAFNRNMPYDRFVIEQLAGDLLPNPTMDQRIATGFNRCNITTNEGGSIDDEVNVMYARDRTETASEVFMGTTAGCAVCHDHKFDPLTQKEFYSLSAYFNNTTQAALDGNIKDTPPAMVVPLAGDRDRYAAIPGKLDTLTHFADARRRNAQPEFASWLRAADPQSIAATLPAANLRFLAPLDEGRGRTINVLLDGHAAALTATAEPGWGGGEVAARAFQRQAGSTVEVASAGDFENNQSFSGSAWVKLAPDANGSIVSRMDDQHDYRGWDMWLQGNRFGTHIISKWPMDALKVVSRDPIPAGQWHHVCFTYGGGRTKESVHLYIDGVPQPVDIEADSLKSSIRTTVPFKIGQRFSSSGIDNSSIQEVRLYDKALSPDEVGRLAHSARAAYLATRGASQLTGDERGELYDWWLTQDDSEYRTFSGQIAGLRNEADAIRQRGTVALVSQEKPQPPVAYVLFRGDYDKRREAVSPGTPAFLPAMPAGYPKNRLGLARWLMLPEHPLTARVAVNRLWQELYGTGLVRTSEDFGVSGEEPSDPQLLDWLAVDFRENGWDIKRLVKEMVMSAAYRQSSAETPQKRLLDPQNRLISRGPRYRMDAEMVRDYALAASGLLNDTIGGPSVKPYQPDGVWEAVAISGSDTRFYQRDSGDKLYRRSLYTFWKRSAPPASMAIFNAPSREKCTLRRERTDTPLQALVTLNDPQFIEAARALAQHAILEGGPDPEARLGFVMERLLARPARPQELALLKATLGKLSAYYAAHPEDARALIAVGESKADSHIAPQELAAWTMLVNAMMNLDEVLNT